MRAVPRTGADEASATISVVDLAAAVSALQVELVGVKSRMRERETETDSLRETIVNLTHENQLLKRRIYGNKTERSQTSELQLSLGDLFEAEKQLQKQLDQAVAQANGQPADGTPPEKQKPKTKPSGTGRRDWLVSDLPRSCIEILDPELEKRAKRIGFEEALHLVHRRGGWSVLVKRTAKYEVAGKDGPTVLGVEAPKTLFPRGMLHSSVVAHILVQKFALGVPHYRLEQHLDDQGTELSRITMSRYVEEAGNALGATIVHAMWRDAIENGAVISTDATSALIQPEKSPKGQRQACKKAHFFTAVVDTDCSSPTPSGTRRTSSKSSSAVSRASSSATRITSTTFSKGDPRSTTRRGSPSSGVGLIVDVDSSKQPSASTQRAFRADAHPCHLRR
jgi:transposase